MSGWQNNTTIVSTLKLSLTGTRFYTSPAAYYNQTAYGYYWASTPNADVGAYLWVSPTQVHPETYEARAIGFSVRCLKN